MPLSFFEDYQENQTSPLYGFPEKRKTDNDLSEVTFTFGAWLLFYLWEQKAFEKALSAKDPLFSGSSKMLQGP